MPYPSGTLFPSPLLYPGVDAPVGPPASTIQIGSLLLNAVDANGTKWPVTKFDGWHGTSDPTLSPVQKTRASGATVGDSFSTGRTMTITGLIISTSAAQQSQDWDTLNAAISRQSTLMQVSESGRVRWVMVSRSSAITPNKINAWMSGFTVQVFAKDWRKFGSPLTDYTLLPSSVGGYSYPGFKFPYDIPARSLSGQVTLNNPGNEVGPVVLQVNGPATGPAITHRGSGAQLTFASNLVLGVGEFLLIDMEKKSVLANGQPGASRNAFITNRGWSGFDPGDNTWAFTAATFNASSQLAVTATPSWE
jgi:hypothetical protein